MAELPRKVDINIAAIPVRGFGGMCMVVTSIVCAASLPQTRWFMLAALAAGIVFGSAMILLRGAKGGRPPDPHNLPAAREGTYKPLRHRGFPVFSLCLRVAAARLFLP